MFHVKLMASAWDNRAAFLHSVFIFVNLVPAQDCSLERERLYRPRRHLRSDGILSVL